MRRQSVFFQLFLTLVVLLGVTILSTGYFGIQSLRSYAEADAVERQLELVKTLALLLNDSNIEGGGGYDEYLDSLPDSLGYRITIIDKDGTVLGDTHERASIMDNHGSRPEVISACETGVGNATRRSYTLSGELLIYSAWLDEDRGLVFRVARTVRGLQKGLNRSVTTLTVFAVVLILISIIISIIAARRVSRLINGIRNVADHYAGGDFSVELNMTGFREAEDLSRSLNLMGRQLHDTILDLEFRQNELQSMLEGMTAPVVLTDAAMDIREINPAGLALAAKKGDCIGRSLKKVFRNRELRNLAKELLETGESREAFIELERPGGIVRLQVNASPVQREGEAGAGCLLVMNDITRITQLEKVRKDFVANVSHELRTPITSILGFVETLRGNDNIDRDRQVGFLDIIHRQTVRLEHIISDLMVLSRLEEGDAAIPRESMKVEDLFDGALSILEHRAEARGTRISTDCVPGLCCFVYPNLAEQALTNLLDNAIKYSPEGTKVKLAARKTGKGVVVTVKDKGPGIPESEHVRIFERFHRVDKARSRELGGTGLGLAIVKHIALKHGGRVWVESRKGAGSAFRILFPSGEGAGDGC